MSFQIHIAPNRRAATRFIGKVRRKLAAAMADNPNVKRTMIADELGVHRSVITRQLNGKADLGLGRVAEIAWILGYEPKFDLVRREPEESSNIAPSELPQPMVQMTTTSNTVSLKKQSTVDHFEAV